ncbi:MAG: hypothetical protein U1E12_01290 [Hydrogenophaga sp.]|jgi:hypothetical protein|uniref:hypothetical protein n=1 Tax=Hydrogenophaga sp. TaxID=1904254 RepID=UPI002ABA0F5F|nr:hypothetical protein [Hydrogenophaga sp.]MDZ4100291.1 hypothetical protein [Hydrogenophaga sp.]
MSGRLLEGRFEEAQSMSWSKLLNPVFEIDLVHRPYCGGELKIIEALEEQAVIEKMLA